MTFDSKKADHQKLRRLWVSLFAYLLLVLLGLNYATALRYPILGVVGVLNMAIIFAFVLAIKRAYLRVQTQIGLEGSKASDVPSDSRRELDRRRLKWLWAGAAVYFLACLNALTYVRDLPYKVLIALSTFNAGLAVVFILELKNVYKRLRH
jgi:hypothetical protein